MQATQLRLDRCARTDSEGFFALTSGTTPDRRISLTPVDAPVATAIPQQKPEPPAAGKFRIIRDLRVLRSSLRICWIAY
jgi:hypothetical protein